MRSLMPCLVLLALPVAAHATTFTFSFSGQDPELQAMGIDQPYNESFTINTSQVIAPSAENGFNCSDGSCFTVVGGNDGYLSFTRGGEINESGEIGETPDETISLYTNSDEITPVTLFSGSSLNPIMASGNFYASVDFADQAFNPEGPLSIIDPPSTSAVPEPSTLALLGSGAIGIAATLRRRLAW